MSNRSKFAAVIASHTHSDAKTSDELLQVFTKSLRTQLLKEGEAVLPGFGRVILETRAPRKGHNPKTGAVIDIPSKQVIKFKIFPEGLEEV